MCFERKIRTDVMRGLQNNPVVAIIGTRQVVKTNLENILKA